MCIKCVDRWKEDSLVWPVTSNGHQTHRAATCWLPEFCILHSQFRIQANFVALVALFKLELPGEPLSCEEKPLSSAHYGADWAGNR